MKWNKILGLASALAVGASAHAEVKVSGYVDAGFLWAGKATAGIAGAQKNNKFDLNEGLVGVSGSLASATGLVEYNYVGNAVKQAFVGYSFDNGIGFQVGQISNFSGYEGSTSLTRHFARQGLIRETLYATRAGGLNAANTGVVLTYGDADSVSFAATVFNDGTSSLDDPGFGLKVAGNFGGMDAQVTSIFQSTAAGESGYTIGLGLGTEFGDMHLNAELALIKAAVANAESGLAAGLCLGQNFSDDMSGNVSFEWSNGKADGAVKRAYSLLRVGPRFQISEALHTDITYAMTMASQPTGFVKVKPRHEALFSAVYAF